jgi:predicted RNA-binding Zn ribbon-like protein
MFTVNGRAVIMSYLIKENRISHAELRMDAEATLWSLIDAIGQLMMTEASCTASGAPCKSQRTLPEVNRIGNLFTDHVAGVVAKDIARTDMLRNLAAAQCEGWLDRVHNIHSVPDQSSTRKHLLYPAETLVNPAKTGSSKRSVLTIPPLWAMSILLSFM